MNNRLTCFFAAAFAVLLVGCPAPVPRTGGETSAPTPPSNSGPPATRRATTESPVNPTNAGAVVSTSVTGAATTQPPTTGPSTTRPSIPPNTNPPNTALASTSPANTGIPTLTRPELPTRITVEVAGAAVARGDLSNKTPITVLSGSGLTVPIGKVGVPQAILGKAAANEVVTIVGRQATASATTTVVAKAGADGSFSFTWVCPSGAKGARYELELSTAASGVQRLTIECP
jgi:hypothetical protein